MTKINTQMKTLLDTYKGFVRVFGLTNGTAVNNVKNGKSEKLSESTMDKIAAGSGYEAVTVFVPKDGSNTQIADCIEDANNAFIADITTKLATDKETKDAAAAERMKIARAKMEENKAAKEAEAPAAPEVPVEVEAPAEVTLDIDAV